MVARLALKKESLTSLTDHELDVVVGGATSPCVAQTVSACVVSIVISLCVCTQGCTL